MFRLILTAAPSIATPRIPSAGAVSAAQQTIRERRAAE